MTDLHSFLALATFSMVGSITPGPNNLMLMASGTNFGFRQSLPHIFGVSIGFCLMLLIIGSGIGLALHGSKTLTLAMKVASAIYLLYLAWKIASAPVDTGSATTPGAKPITFLQAVAFQWVNPKAWAMGLTAFTVYSRPEWGMIGVIYTTAVISLVGAPASLVWTTAGIQLRRLLDRPIALRMFNIGAAVLLIASLAITL